VSRFKSLVALRISENAACLGLASVLALCGCSAVQVKLGMRVSLAKTPIASIEASLPKDPGIAPGEKSPLVVTVTGPDGKVLVTEGKGKGKVLWKDLTVTATVVTANKKGVLSLPRDPRVSDGKMGHVAITVPSHPEIHTELDIPLRYDYKFVSNFSGSSGSNGTNGSDGTDGLSGSSGSMDPNNPSPGGNGSNGTNGSDGSDGGSGGDCPPVQVRVTLRTRSPSSPANSGSPASHPLLQIGVSSAGHKERFYLVDPQGGSLTVNADGGPGKGVPRRPRRFRRYWNAQWIERERRLQRTRRQQWLVRPRRKHNRDLRSAGETIPGNDQPLQSGWPRASIYRRIRISLVVMPFDA
jgi:hypothetical protein